MTGFTDPFGGSTLEAAQVSYSLLPITASVDTVWPQYYVGDDAFIARLMDITASVGSLSISLPDATQVSPGQDIFFNNFGAYTIIIKDNAGNSLASIAAGQQRYFYLIDNSSVGGTWRVMLFGIGASSPDASQLAGLGLTAIGATLNQSSPVQTVIANTTWLTSDRAGVFVNIGGTITGTLPDSATAGDDYFIEVRNQGSGAWTIAGVGGQTIDGSASIVLQVNESCFIHSGSSTWYTVGRGRNTAFNFTELLKTVTGGTTTLSLTEASNVVQVYSGALLSNEIVVLPAVVQVYYIQNNTTGAYSFTLQSPTPGTTLTLPTGQTAVVVCDGINVINASTSVAGISSLLLSAGSVGSPSLAISGANNGFYAPTSISIALSVNGSNVMTWAAGQQLAIAGAVGAPTYSFQGSAGTGFYSPAANQIGVSINSTLIGTWSASGLALTALSLTTALTVPNGGTGAATITGLVKGNGASAMTAATSNTDYLPVTNPKSVGTKETKVVMGANDIDLSTANYFTKTITGNVTLTVSNVPASGTTDSFILVLTNGGAFTITWWANVKWAAGIAPTLTSSGVDLLGFFTFDNGANWYGLVLGKNMA